MKLWHSLIRFGARTPVLLASLVLMLVFCVLMNAPGLPTSGASFERLAGAPVFDFRLAGDDLAALNDTLTRAGAEGRRVYERFMILDIAFPAIYALFWVGLLQRQVGALDAPWRWAPAVPVLTALIDYGENFLVAGALATHPHTPAWLVSLASACTQAKLGATALLLATVTLVLLRGALRRLLRTP